MQQEFKIVKILHKCFKRTQLLRRKFSILVKDRLNGLGTSENPVSLISTNLLSAFI